MALAIRQLVTSRVVYTAVSRSGFSKLSVNAIIEVSLRFSPIGTSFPTSKRREQSQRKGSSSSLRVVDPGFPLCCDYDKHGFSKLRIHICKYSTHCSKDKVEKPATSVGETGPTVLQRITPVEAAAAAAAASMAAAASSPTAGSPPMIKKAVVELSSREQQCRTAPHSVQRWPSSIFSPSSSHTTASKDVLTSEEESTPKTVEAGKLEPVAVSSFKAIPQSSKNRGVGAGHSTSKLKITQASGACRTLLAPQTLHGRRGCFLLSSSPS